MLSTEAKTPNLRVRRTRMLIEKAFNELLQEQSFQSITVQDIAERAMVNRATFYDHFVDKYALFEHIMRNWFRQTLEGKRLSEIQYCSSNIGLIIETVGEFLSQIDTHCRPHNPEGLPAFDEQIVELVTEVLLNWFSEKHSGIAPKVSNLTANVAAWAMYGAARHWSLQKRREPIQTFAAQAAPMILNLIDQKQIVTVN